jgi:hypothetical protein
MKILIAIPATLLFVWLIAGTREFSTPATARVEKPVEHAGKYFQSVPEPMDSTTLKKH